MRHVLVCSSLYGYKNHTSFIIFVLPLTAVTNPRPVRKPRRGFDRGRAALAATSCRHRRENRLPKRVFVSSVAAVKTFSRANVVNIDVIAFGIVVSVANADAAAANVAVATAVAATVAAATVAAANAVAAAAVVLGDAVAVVV